MSRRIGVFGNCDTGGISASLKLLLKQDNIQPLVLPKDADARHKWSSSLKERIDILLVNNSQMHIHKAALQDIGVDIVVYPQIIFRAFHPDLYYVGRTSTNSVINPSYNSAICIWCYLSGVPADRVATLFNREVFAALGYFDVWDGCVEELRQRFVNTGFDFRPFFLAVKRTGAFMHSVDHPKATALIALAKSIAIKLGAAESIREIPVPISDSLANLDWPIYPDIGEYYGIRGLYVWKEGVEYLTLHSYIDAAYQKYSKLELKKEDMFYGPPSFRKQLDAVLGAGVGA